MNYYIDLFSPETAKAFSNSNQDISGFRISRKTYVENQKISPGDRFICYCTRIQRLIGVLEVASNPFIDKKPIFTQEDDPFILRFKVKVIVWLPLIKSVPIHNDFIWNNLTFTKELSKDSNKWTYMVFSSPRLWPKDDCVYIEKVLIEQNNKQVDYPFTEADEKKLKPSKIKISSKKEVSISIPEDDEEKAIEASDAIESETRESIKVQAQIASIGEKLGFKIWLPRNDRNKVLEVWNPSKGTLLDDLPLVFDDTTLRTIQNIDVLWIKRRSIVRAFEVENTTSIYSGILRMADLLSLQPMLDIKIHIVAPQERRDSVFKQITRPVFAVMEKGPLSELCSYISFDSISELSKEKRLEHMTDTIVDEYAEFTEE
ncbi:MAG: hypothetical protein JXA50_06025 [Deltaproteobacteria bacterium]|nr:hypothetical protein [Deltaproteobacteria bacterium]